jgi:hypothetical protein
MVEGAMQNVSFDVRDEEWKEQGVEVQLKQERERCSRTAGKVATKTKEGQRCQAENRHETRLMTKCTPTLNLTDEAEPQTDNALWQE